MGKRLVSVFDAGVLKEAVEGQFGGTPRAIWGVGVSGGSDSVALLVGLVKAGFGADLVVLHMNHGWGEADEAAEAFVEALCDDLDVSLVVGEGGGVPDGGSAEAAARGERFAFYKEQVALMGLKGVMLGHQAEDAVEHMLIRLARGSGLQGLAGLGSESVVEGIIYVRPLLKVQKEALRDFLRAEGVAWQDDAKLEAPALRERLRAALPGLLEAGFDVEAVLGSLEALQDAESVVKEAVEGVLKGLKEEKGGWVLEKAALTGCLKEVGARVVQEMVVRASGNGESIRRGKRVALWERICGETKGVGELGGVRFEWDGKRVIAK